MGYLLISLLALYNQDDTILNSTNFPLPEGASHEVLDPLLLAETAELEVLFTDPDTLKTVIKAWATARNTAWARMIEALNEEYNPLHNYDRSETWTDETEKNTLRGGTSSGTGHGEADQKTSVAGFNDNTNLANKDRIQNETDTTSETEFEESVDDTGTVTHTGRVQGNIGVTTSAQMLAGELDIRKNDIYHIIINEFTKRFCLGVY